MVLTLLTTFLSPKPFLKVLPEDPPVAVKQSTVLEEHMSEHLMLLVEERQM